MKKNLHKGDKLRYIPCANKRGYMSKDKETKELHGKLIKDILVYGMGFLLVTPDAEQILKIQRVDYKEVIKIAEGLDKLVYKEKDK